MATPQGFHLSGPYVWLLADTVFGQLIAQDATLYSLSRQSQPIGAVGG